MEEHLLINTFIEKFSRQTILSVTPFSSLYDEIISDSYKVQQEIKGQFVAIASEKNIHYLNYVKERFIVEILNKISIPTIDKWAETTHLNTSDFPFLKNEEVKKLLDIWIEQPFLDLEIQNKAQEMQKDFYLYAVFMEVTKIIRLIDQLLKAPNDNKKTDVITSQTFKLKGDTQKNIKDKAIDLYYSLLKNEYLIKDCKKDFIKLFTGQQPEHKIDWQGLKGELKLFINLLIEENKIDDCRSSKWIITAANFRFSDKDFTPETINSTKKAKHEHYIKTIVNRI